MRSPAFLARRGGSGSSVCTLGTSVCDLNGLGAQSADANEMKPSAFIRVPRKAKEKSGKEMSIARHSYGLQQ